MNSGRAQGESSRGFDHVFQHSHPALFPALVCHFMFLSTCGTNSLLMRVPALCAVSLRARPQRRGRAMRQVAASAGPDDGAHCTCTWIEPAARVSPLVGGGFVHPRSPPSTSASWIWHGAVGAKRLVRGTGLDLRRGLARLDSRPTHRRARGRLGASLRPLAMAARSGRDSAVRVWMPGRAIVAYGIPWPRQARSAQKADGGSPARHWQALPAPDGV
jgi:hypothetical protein